jgi:hypothetical protein
VIGRRSGIAFRAVQPVAEPAGPPRFGDHPWPLYPRRIVAHVLEMAARQLRDPMVLFVQMKSGDGLLHDYTSPRAHRPMVWGASGIDRLAALTATRRVVCGSEEYRG